MATDGPGASLPSCENFSSLSSYAIEFSRGAIFMTRDPGLKAVGLICFAVAGCAPSLDLNRLSKTEAPPLPGLAPICEVRSTGPSFATIVCRDTDRPSVADPQDGRQDGPRIEPRLIDRDQPALDDERKPAAFAAVEPVLSDEPRAPRTSNEESSSEDALAPDPFAGPRRQARLRPSGPLAEDDLAPDPFGESRQETRLHGGRRLAEDDLAPDPFAGPRHEARTRVTRPLSEDALAPVPFGPVR